MKELIHYTRPEGPLPALVGTKAGKQLLVIGSAATVWDDLSRVDPKQYDLMAVNDVMIHYPWGQRLDYGVTLHPEKLPGWGFFQAYQASHNAWPPMETMSIRQVQGGHVKHVWPIHRSGGNSGLFGVFTGLFMDYDLIVLAGIPCDDTPRYFDPPGWRHEQFAKDVVFREWQEANERIFKNRVRSLSGRTRDLLGES